MFKVVLVPIDVSQPEAAASAAGAAREIAGREDAKLILLNVIETVPAYVAIELPSGIHQEAVSNAQDTLAQMVTDHKLPAGTEILVRDGHPTRTILDVAQETQTNVIVIASHDPGLADYLLGSVAARVVRHAHCSVLVVRNVKQ